jgi:hypothetical protein
MSKMGLHDPFGDLKQKLWPKESAEQFVNINKLVFSSSIGNGSASRDPLVMCFVL